MAVSDITIDNPEETPQVDAAQTDLSDPVNEAGTTAKSARDASSTAADVPVKAPSEVTETPPDTKEEPAITPTTEEPEPVSPPQITAPIFVSKRTTFPELLFSLGLASVFIMYAAVIYLHPDAVKLVYTTNPLGKNVGHANVVLEAAQFVNIFLAILVLISRWKTTVYGFAGAWLLVIALFKLLNLTG